MLRRGGKGFWEGVLRGAPGGAEGGALGPERAGWDGGGVAHALGSNFSITSIIYKLQNEVRFFVQLRRAEGGREKLGRNGWGSGCVVPEGLGKASIV